MSFEKFNPFKNQEDPPRPNRKKKEEEKGRDPKMSRRNFLKKTAVLGAGIVLGKSLAQLIEYAEEDEKDPQKEASREQAATPEQKQIQEENIKSITEILDFDKPGPIELTPRTMEAIKNHWKEKYKKDSRLRESLQKGYEEMGAWTPYIKERFHQQDVPEKFIYLALPESHWQLEARSPAGAVGPYQFMPKTARMYGLKTDYYADNPRNLEERSDPLKSASACAALLKDLYKTSKDWDLSLAGYNGGYFWKYLKKAYAQDQEISYKGFLKYLEARINTIKKDLEDKECYEYQIKKGDNLGKIAKKFNISLEKLCSDNNIKDKNKIYVGQRLKLPASHESKRKIFEDKIKYMVENLNYPPKFNAVYELIEEGFVNDSQEPITFKHQEIEAEPQKYTFSKEDKNIYRLAQKFPQITAQDILQANPHIDPADLRGGEELTIPSLTARPTLRVLAKKNNKSISRLQDLNPAVRDPDLPLPYGYKLRI